MLRAVLSLAECSRVIAPQSITYVGDQFPTPAADLAGRGDFAVLSIAPEETTSDWRPGFYRSDGNLDKINQALLELKR